MKSSSTSLCCISTPAFLRVLPIFSALYFSPEATISRRISNGVGSTLISFFSSGTGAITAGSWGTASATKTLSEGDISASRVSARGVAGMAAIIDPATTAESI